MFRTQLAGPAPLRSPAPLELHRLRICFVHRRGLLQLSTDAIYVQPHPNFSSEFVRRATWTLNNVAPERLGVVLVLSAFNGLFFHVFFFFSFVLLRSFERSEVRGGV